MTLDDIAADVVADKTEIRSLDLSEAMGKPVGSVVFQYRVPDVAAMFQRNEDADVLRKQNPTLPRSLCSQIALMALCHTAPLPDKKQGQPIGVLYQSFTKNMKLWTQIENGFALLFPEIYGTELKEKAKNDSGATDQGTES